MTDLVWRRGKRFAPAREYPTHHDEAVMNGAPRSGGSSELQLITLDGVGLVSHLYECFSHEGEALENTGERIGTVNLVLKVDVAGILHLDQRFEDFANRHDAIAYVALTLFFVRID